MNNVLKLLVAAVMAASACGTAAAQTFDVDPQPATTVTGTAAGAPSKDDMLSRVRRWVAITFAGSDVIDMTDPAAGTIVLKWSAPLAQPSQWLTATLSETCVIDLRDGGRWRMQVYSPRISWAITEAATMLDDMGLANPEAAADTRHVSGITQRVYAGSMDWPLDEQLDAVAAAYLEQLNSTQQFRNERDRERGRATDEYRTAERQWRIVNDVRRAAQSYSATLTQSLARAMATTNDF